MANIAKLDAYVDKKKVKKIISLTKSKEAADIIKAVEALAKIGGEDALNTITLLAENSADEDVRAAAMAGMGVCGNSASMTLLNYFMKNEKSEKILAAVKPAIAALRGKLE